MSNSGGEKNIPEAKTVIPDQNARRNFCPVPELLEGYNYVVEGSAARILQMFETEQKHRHEWEVNALKTHSFSTILGQVLGFFIAATVFVSAAAIGMHGNSTTAALIWVFGLAIIVMSGLVWVYAKSMGQRPLFGRPTMRTHFRAEKMWIPKARVFMSIAVQNLVQTFKKRREAVASLPSNPGQLH